jgi:hypothetical protein
MATQLTFTDDCFTELTCYANPKNILITIKSIDSTIGINIMLDLDTSKNFLNHMASQIKLFENFKTNSNE